MIGASRWRALLIAGLAVRGLTLPLAGTGDMDIWKTWSYGAARGVSTMYGVGGQPPERAVISWGRQHMTVDYPPAALYGLALLGRAYRAFDPSFSDGVALTVAIKLSILLADVAVAWGLWTLIAGRPRSPGGGSDREAAQTAVLLYWLNPATLMDGAVLGYLDPWVGALAMASLVAMDRGHAARGGAAFALAALTKLQGALLLPFTGLVLLRRAGRGRGRAIGIAGVTVAATVAAVLAPYARIGALPNVRQGVGSLLRHDMLSGEAANLWWIVTWLLRAAYATADLGAWAAWTMRVHILGISRVIDLGYPSPRAIGALAAGVPIGWAIWRVRRAPTAQVLAAGALAVHAYFVLDVQVHENHLYLALPLMAAAAAELPPLRQPFYAVSAVFAMNLFLFQGVGRGLPMPPRGVTIVDATVLLAFVNLGALAWHARRFAAVTRSETEDPAAIPTRRPDRSRR